MKYENNFPVLEVGYLEYQLENLSKPNYARIQSHRINEILGNINTKNQVTSKNLKAIIVSASNSQNVYIFLKHLFLIHQIIRNSKTWKMFFLENLSKITLDRIIKLCRMNKFDQYVSNNLIYPYLNYIKKICASCEVYTFIVSQNQEQKQQQIKPLFLFGVISLLRYSIQLIPFLQKYYQLFKSTYPFILDIYLIISKDIKCMSQKISYIGNYCRKQQKQRNQDYLIYESAIQEIQILQQSIRPMFRNEFLMQQIPTTIVTSQENQPMFEQLTLSKIDAFFETNQKITPIKRYLFKDALQQDKQNMDIQETKIYDLKKNMITDFQESNVNILRERNI